MGLWSKLFGKKKKQDNLDENKDQVLAKNAEQQERLKEDVRTVSLEEVEKDIRTVEQLEPSQIKPERTKRQQIFSADEEEVVNRAANLQDSKETVDQAPEATLAKEKPADSSSKEEPSKAYNIKKHAKGWQIIAEGANRAYRVFDTQKEAIDFAKENDLEVTVYKADGTPK
ncbi:DUF2188 domain-containing protein [Liberiplasma polymorphum]|jgi:hypothetical protein|uniref:DUF2188 domain-containing protein n=1 Tax=Liberiplasma polymorphum TaxID=3374570 RepID=UPI003773F364